VRLVEHPVPRGGGVPAAPKDGVPGLLSYIFSVLNTPTHNASLRTYASVNTSSTLFVRAEWGGAAPVDVLSVPDKETQIQMWLCGRAAADAASASWFASTGVPRRDSSSREAEDQLPEPDEGDARQS
jgi:hypothetical protein